MDLLQAPSAGELRELLESDAFSGVISVVIDGRPVLEFAGGCADRQTGRLNTLQTRFSTASVGKIFSAVCIARLVDAAICQFEQPLVEIVPVLQPHFDADLSLAALLSHRSGLGDYVDDDAALPFAGMDLVRLDCPQAFLPYVLRAPRFPAGQFRYSSAGFILLGLAIETLTRQNYPTAIAEWVTNPTKLTSSGFPSLRHPPSDLAIGYLPDGRPNCEHLPIVGGADGGIVTNAQDLTLFFENLRSGNFLRATTRQFLWNSVSVTGDETAYGHGFDIVKACGRSWYGERSRNLGAGGLFDGASIVGHRALQL
jgi:CubicO group peptidase (beta-lactamase class C family)